MSNVDPRWPAPVEYRPRALGYVLAAVLPLLLVAGLVLPAGVLWARADRRPAGGPAAPATPSADQGQPGVGDPYFPDYGSSGYDAARYRIVMTFDPGSGVLSATTTITARATQPLRELLRRPRPGVTAGHGRRRPRHVHPAGVPGRRHHPRPAGGGRRHLRGRGDLRRPARRRAPGPEDRLVGHRPGVDGGRRAGELGLVVPGQRPPLRPGPDGRLDPCPGRDRGDQRRPAGLPRHRPGAGLGHLALGGLAADGDLPRLRQHRAVRPRRGTGRRPPVRVRGQSAAVGRGPPDGDEPAAVLRGRGARAGAAVRAVPVHRAGRHRRRRTSCGSAGWRPRPGRCTTRRRCWTGTSPPS